MTGNERGPATELFFGFVAGTAPPLAFAACISSLADFTGHPVIGGLSPGFAGLCPVQLILSIPDGQIEVQMPVEIRIGWTGLVGSSTSMWFTKRCNCRWWILRWTSPSWQVIPGSRSSCKPVSYRPAYCDGGR